MPPLISVIIPVYNAEKYIIRCLESVSAQTYRNLEIIAVNDGSVDGSHALLREYAGREPRLRIIDRPNTGQGRARSDGVNAARGEYVSFVDADDWTEPQMLAKLYDACEKNTAELSCCNFCCVSGDGERSAPILAPKVSLVDVAADRAGYLAAYLYCDEAAGMMGTFLWGKLWKRGIFTDNGLIFREVSEVGAEDALLIYEAIPHIKKVAIVDEILYYYYLSLGSAMRTYHKDAFFRWKRLFHYLEEMLRESGIYEQVLPAVKVRLLRVFAEALYAEVGQPGERRNIYAILSDSWLRRMLRRIPLNRVPLKNKLIYIIYRLGINPVTYWLIRADGRRLLKKRSVQKK